MEEEAGAGCANSGEDAEPQTPGGKLLERDRINTTWIE